MLTNTFQNLHRILGNREIILFGMGRYFKMFIQKYPDLFDRVKIVLDNAIVIGDRKKVCENNHSVLVVNPAEVNLFDKSTFVIVFCSAYYEAMKIQIDELIGIDYDSFVFPFLEDYDLSSEEYRVRTLVSPTLGELEKSNDVKSIYEQLNVLSKEDLGKKILSGDIVTIPRLTIMLTPKCSLRCKECANLMWALRNSRGLDSNKIKSSIKLLSEQIDIIPTVNLIGGEPFVAECFDEILELCINQDKIKNIEIITNGTIIPNSERLHLLKNKKVTVMISKYENVVDNSRLIDVLRFNNINYKETNSKWYSLGGLNKRGRDEKELRLQFFNCYSALMCRTLVEDKLCICPRAAGLYLLGMLNDNAEVLSIDKDTDIRNKVVDFQLVPKMFACDFCDDGILFKKYIPVAEQE